MYGEEEKGIENAKNKEKVNTSHSQMAKGQTEKAAELKMLVNNLVFIKFIQEYGHRTHC